LGGVCSVDCSPGTVEGATAAAVDGGFCAAALVVVVFFIVVRCASGN
jgi:hypothetical protein